MPKLIDMSTNENTDTVAVQPAKPNKIIDRWHRLRAWMVQIDHLQQQGIYAPERDDTQHTCLHCGNEFAGRYCPQCGMPARWKRFTWRLMFLNFMDIWGFGNRSMFRTIRDMFWRPGYMMRDYLNGHHLSYFPPFKMMAVFILILVAIGFLLDANLSQGKLAADSFYSSDGDFAGNMLVLDYLKRFELFMNRHVLYRALLQNVVVVAVVWIIFRRKGKLNFVETAFSQIYINCQFLMIGTLVMLLMWCFSLGTFSPDVPIEARSYPLGSHFPYALPSEYGFTALIAVVLAYDFRQLYGLSWWSTIWRTAAVVAGVIFMFFALLVFAFCMYLGATGTLIGLALLLYFGIYLPYKYIRRNKGHLSKLAYGVCVGSLVYSIFGYICIMLGVVYDSPVLLGLSFSLIFILSMMGLMMLMVWLYKKYHKTWHIFTVLAFMILLSCYMLVVFGDYVDSLIG